MTAWSAIAGSKPTYSADIEQTSTLSAIVLALECTARLHSLTGGDIPSGVEQIKSPTRYLC